jgi:hypothetical protein
MAEWPRSGPYLRALAEWGFDSRLATRFAILGRNLFVSPGARGSFLYYCCGVIIFLSLLSRNWEFDLSSETLWRSCHEPSGILEEVSGAKTRSECRRLYLWLENKVNCCVENKSSDYVHRRLLYRGVGQNYCTLYEEEWGNERKSTMSLSSRGLTLNWYEARDV